MDTPSYGIYITTGERNRTPNLTTTSRARNIFHFKCNHGRRWPDERIQIMGLPGQPVEGVRLDKHPAHQQWRRHGGRRRARPQGTGHGLSRTTQPRHAAGYGVYARHVKDLELANINVSFTKTDLRPAIRLFGCERAGD